MGALILPSSGSICVGTNVVIYTVDRIEPYRLMLEPLWHGTRSGAFRIVTSEFTWLETLAKPPQG